MLSQLLSRVRGQQTTCMEPVASPAFAHCPSQELVKHRGNFGPSQQQRITELHQFAKQQRITRQRGPSAADKRRDTTTFEVMSFLATLLIPSLRSFGCCSMSLSPKPLHRPVGHLGHGVISSLSFCKAARKTWSTKTVSARGTIMTGDSRSCVSTWGLLYPHAPETAPKSDVAAFAHSVPCMRCRHAPLAGRRHRCVGAAPLQVLAQLSSQAVWCTHAGDHKSETWLG